MRKAALGVILVLGAIAIAAGASAIADARDGPRMSWSEAMDAVNAGQSENAELHRSVVVDGGEWRFASSRDAAGRSCVSNTVPGEGVGSGCIDTATLFQQSAVVALPGARQRESFVNQGHLGWHNMWIYGFVRTDVTSLELINMDCSIEAVPFDNRGAFLHVVGFSEIRAGRVPFRMRARDAAGRPIYGDNVSINVPPTAQEAGIDKPSPGEDCR